MFEVRDEIARQRGKAFQKRFPATKNYGSFLAGRFNPFGMQSKTGNLVGSIFTAASEWQKSKSKLNFEDYVTTSVDTAMQPSPKVVEETETVDTEKARRRERKRLQTGGRASTILSGRAAALMTALKKRLGA